MPPAAMDRRCRTEICLACRAGSASRYCSSRSGSGHPSLGHSPVTLHETHKKSALRGKARPNQVSCSQFVLAEDYISHFARNPAAPTQLYRSEKCTPVRHSDRQTIRQHRAKLSASMIKSKTSGMPAVLGTSRQVPVEERMATVQFNTEGLSLKTIRPAFSVR
jgi:hypothetical protein